MNNVLVEDILNIEKEMFPSIYARTIHVQPLQRVAMRMFMHANDLTKK
jgi:hypothetical protein